MQCMRCTTRYLAGGENSGTAEEPEAEIAHCLHNIIRKSKRLRSKAESQDAMQVCTVLFFVAVHAHSRQSATVHNACFAPRLMAAVPLPLCMSA